MRKKFIGVTLAAVMAAGLAGCDDLGGTGTDAMAADTQTTETRREETKDDARREDEKEDLEVSDSKGASDFHTGIIASSVFRSEDDRCGAEAFQAMYDEDMIKLAAYPDNFTEELETIIQTIVSLSDDPRVKTITVNQSIPGTAEAFRKIKEVRPDILCIAGKGHKNLPEVSSAADPVCNNNFATHGYLIIRTAHEFGCGTFVHISFPCHTAYETMSRRMVVTKEACKESGIEFVLETAPDPTSDVGVAGAQVCILEEVPGWVERYGKNTAYSCINNAHTESLSKQLMEYGGHFIEADLPSPLMGYPGALGIDPAAEAGDLNKVLTKVKPTIVEKDGADHFEAWAYSYGYIISAGLAQHALNALSSESELDDTDNATKVYQVSSPKAEWNGSSYANMETGVKLGNVFLAYQDTYIMDDPGHFMGSTKIEVPEKCFTIKQDTY